MAKPIGKGKPDHQPAMLWGIDVDLPIYDYGADLYRKRRMPELPPSVLPSFHHQAERGGGHLCAIGACPTCGRTVSSAVHEEKHPLRMLCGRCYEWPT